MALPTLYAYNLDPVRSIIVRGACTSLDFLYKEVNLEHQNLVIEDLLVGRLKNMSGNCFTEEMLLLDGFDSDDLDLILEKIRKEDTKPFKYKAIVTDYNRKLTSYQLFRTIKAEANEIAKNK